MAEGDGAGVSIRAAGLGAALVDDFMACRLEGDALRRVAADA